MEHMSAVVESVGWCIKNLPTLHDITRVPLCKLELLAELKGSVAVDAAILPH
jgi:hypothetical protein